MFDVMEMPMDWPAEVNYHEAKAFCAWKGSDYRLPTEAEHHVMRGPQVGQCLAQMIEFQNLPGGGAPICKRWGCLSENLN